MEFSKIDYTIIQYALKEIEDHPDANYQDVKFTREELDLLTAKVLMRLHIPFGPEIEGEVTVDV